MDGTAVRKSESAQPPTGRLDSWKEIANYLKRGARTVQRWEREEGLPVHRLRHDKLGSVYAYQSELDAWWESRRETFEPEAVPAPVERHSIAVLPFVDLSPERDQGYFCEGIAEEIIGTLSRIRGLRVASRTSSFQFREATANVKEIGRSLRVAALLEGSVRKSGSRLRISVQLVNAANGYQMWAGTYDRTLGDVFEIQADIGGSIAKALELTLSPRETEALKRAPTSDLEAYDLYLHGRKFYNQYAAVAMEYAIQLFTRAVEKDSSFSLAYSGLADSWSFLYLYSERKPLLLEMAGMASLRAVELDADSGQAQASRALVLLLEDRIPEAEDAFERAIRLDGTLFEARYQYARHCSACGKPKEALKLYEEAMRIRPEDYQSPLLMAQIYEDLGAPDRAKAIRKEGVRLAEQHLRWNPDDVRAIYMAANGMAGLGQRKTAREWVERALSIRPADSMVLYNAGCVYSMLGLHDEALSALERSVERGLVQRGWFEHDSNLAAVRGDARFQELLKKL